MAAAEHAWLAAAHEQDAVLARVILPPRGPVNSKRNFRRVQVVAAALHQAKVARLTTAQRDRHRPSRCHLCRVHVSVR